MSFGAPVLSGKVIAHGCAQCGGVVFGIVRDQGTVPTAIQCQNDECYGQVAVVQKGWKLPPENMICWEWYEPNYRQRQELKITDFEQFLAAESGFLVIRRRQVPMATGTHYMVDAEKG